ncbi:hypothetical protein PNOK_0948000 [Pyrrhoderma noxium]|uniref:Retrotransposon gag domain-containing protein n=1 Tax=Pyrrhoderma noxium TaxID=2282107 RepID=A0A286U5U4_9AGAM|nr:hypothetical protein PNOK_0948000 [Pyrrhoderma noxium]
MIKQPQLPQFVNQQAVVAAQNSASTPASIPAPTPIPRPSKVHVTKPLDFDSNDYDTFKRVIGFYLLAAYQDFAVEQDQILLNKAFIDPNQVTNAQYKLSNLQLGKKSYNEFFQQFEIYAQKARYDSQTHQTYLVSLLKIVLPLKAITHILSSCPKPVTYEAWKAQALTYKEIELEKKAIHYSFSAFSSKPHNS